MITGGGIKLCGTIQEAQQLDYVLLEMERVTTYMIRNGIIDHDDLV